MVADKIAYAINSICCVYVATRMTMFFGNCGPVLAFSNNENARLSQLPRRSTGASCVILFLPEHRGEREERAEIIPELQIRWKVDIHLPTRLLRAGYVWKNSEKH